MDKRRDSKRRILRNGESIREDGRYQFKYRVNGKAKFVYSWRLEPTDPVPKGKKPGPSLRELEKELGKDLESLINPNQKGMLVMELVERYLKTRTGVRPNTLKNYNFVKNLLSKEEFSGKRIGEVKMSDAKLFLIKLQEDGKGYSTIKSVRGVLRPAFQMAVDDDLLLKNPFNFELLRVIVNDSVMRDAISPDQMRKFLRFVHDDNCYCRYYETVYILFHTRMRISEFCGLTVNDIDFDKHTINVDKQLIRDARMVLHIQETKTSSGKRVLPMKKEVEECFRTIVEDRNAEKPVAEGDVIQMEKDVNGHRGFLFLDDKGLPLVAMHWEHRFNCMVKRYNEIYKVQMPKITPHVCRHTYCSNMARNGMNPKTLQYLMGHSDISVTMNTYTHLGLEDAAAEMKRLEEVERARVEQERMDDPFSEGEDDHGMAI
jgi:integrase